MIGCQVGSKCPILNAKQGKLWPTCFSDEGAAGPQGGPSLNPKP
jgi:hypothetical protein